MYQQLIGLKREEIENAQEVLRVLKEVEKRNSILLDNAKEYDEAELYFNIRQYINKKKYALLSILN